MSPLRRKLTFAITFESLGILLASGFLMLTLLMVPCMAWWLRIALWQALVFESGLIIRFLIYTYTLTWVFDRLFGLPKSAL